MMIELGAKVGDGAGAEVFTLDNDRVVKLFRPGTNWGVAQHEVRVTRIARESGALAPMIYGITEVGGRIGIILSRYDGSTIINLFLAGELSAKDMGTALANVHYSLHAPGYISMLPTFRDWTIHDLKRLERNGTPADIIEAVRSVIYQLPEGGTVCHGDLHPSNIIMTASGPRIVDWCNAVQANPLFDVARLHITLSVFRIDAGGMSPNELDRIRQEVDIAFLQTYAMLAGITYEELQAQIQPYMTVLAAIRMLESSSTAEEQTMLIDYIRSRVA